MLCRPIPWSNMFLSCVTSIFSLESCFSLLSLQGPGPPFCCPPYVLPTIVHIYPNAHPGPSTTLCLSQVGHLTVLLESGHMAWVSAEGTPSAWARFTPSHLYSFLWHVQSPRITPPLGSHFSTIVLSLLSNLFSFFTLFGPSEVLSLLKLFSSTAPLLHLQPHFLPWLSSLLVFCPLSPIMSHSAGKLLTLSETLISTLMSDLVKIGKEGEEREMDEKDISKGSKIRRESRERRGEIGRSERWQKRKTNILKDWNSYISSPPLLKSWVLELEFSRILSSPFQKQYILFTLRSYLIKTLTLTNTCTRVMNGSICELRFIVYAPTSYL